MNWTKERPTKPGWHWMFGYEYGKSLGYLYSDNKELWIYYAFEDELSKEISYILFREFVEFYNITHFMGPLPVPDPPEGAA